MYHLTKLSYLIKLFKPSEEINIIKYDNESLKDCNLDFKIQQCLFNNTENDKHFKPLFTVDIDDFQAFLDWIELIGPIYSFPLISLSGIITNLLVIIVIKSKKNESFFFDQSKKNDRMYNIIVINSILNVIECVISSFNLTTECLGLGSLYCSYIMNMKWAKSISLALLANQLNHALS